MNVANSVLWRMEIIVKTNKGILFVFWYHSPNILDTPRVRRSNLLDYHLNSYNCAHKLPTKTNLTKPKQWIFLNVVIFIFTNYMTQLFNLHSFVL
jgi:hypothetical protein